MLHIFAVNRAPIVLGRPGYTPPLHVCCSVASKSDVPRETWSKMYVDLDFR
jgi:hypothetical protein